MTLQRLLDWLILTISFFNTISLLWLGLMVLLVGNRRSPGVWLTSGGLLLGALFFTSHTAILGRGLGTTGLGMNFWWWVSWTPALTAPLAWYGAMLWHSGYRFDRPHRHHGFLILAGVLILCMFFLLFFANPTPTYQNVAGREIVSTPGVGGIPSLVVLYLLYSLLCYLLPLDLLRRVQGGAPLAERVRQQARPWLMAASLSLLAAGAILSWTALWALTTTPLPTLADLQVEMTVKRFDLAVEVFVAVAITLLGRAIVAYEVFTGQPMPRSRFFRHWRSTVILAGGFGAAAAWMLAIELRPIYTLMMAIALMTLFYALYSWRNFTEREEFMARLRPFVSSQGLYQHMVEPGGLVGNSPDAAGVQDAGEPAQELFALLCRDLLEIRQAVLVPAGSLATLAGPPLLYPPDQAVPEDELLARLVSLEWKAGPPAGSAVASGTAGLRLPPGLDWAIPLWAGHEAKEQRLCGVLLLGEKTGPGPFLEEEIEVAQAAGERLVDLLASAEMARLSLDLLGQRLAQTRILEGQGRRVLHDEVLPELHTAILYLSGGAEEPGKQEALQILTNAHKRISDLMRQLPLAAPYSLGKGGVVAALRSLVENQYSRSFEQVNWCIQPEAEEQARSLPLFMSEVLFFAARELIRNAADHGRGEDSMRELTLWLEMSCAEGRLRLSVADNGVGILLPSVGRKHSSGSGLRIHSAMLAAIGGQLAVMPRSGGGTCAVIDLPLKSFD